MRLIGRFLTWTIETLVLASAPRGVATIPLLEFIAAGVGVITWAPMLGGAELIELETDALATEGSVLRLGQFHRIKKNT